MKKSDKTTSKIKTPQINPYVFTILLLGFGLWCFYDGFLTSDPEMLEHATFNRVLAVILIPWGIWDFYKLQKNKKK